MDLIDICRTFHSNTKDYFLSNHGTFYKFEHLLGHRAHIDRYKTNKKFLHPIWPQWVKARLSTSIETKKKNIQTQGT